MKSINNKKNKSCKDAFKDSDADGISDSVEKKIGTNPFNKDTDRDGLDDYEEVMVYGTDPLNPDTDKDGINDGDEVRMGRNPLGSGKLKNFFIPHEGNNYLPHSLHPRRLIFYTLSSAIIKFVVIFALIGLPVTAWLSVDFLRAESEKIISLTNKIRNQLGINPLISNQVLNNSAQSKAEDMLVQQYFSHISPDNKGLLSWLSQAGYGYFFAGENLAIGYSSAEDVVNAWTASETHYANMIDKDFSEIGAAMVCGLYNNQDTTLAVQFFGTPNAVKVEKEVENNPSDGNYYKPANVDKPVAVDTAVVVPSVESLKEPIEKNTEASSTLTKEIITANTDKEVEVYEPLPIPALINPANGLILSASGTQLQIFSPDSENVIVFLNGYEAANLIKGKEKDYVIVDLNLLEGNNILTLKAIRNNENVFSENYHFTVDSIPPEIDFKNTKIFTDEPQGKQETIIRIVASLSEDTKNAFVSFADHEIELFQDEIEKRKWTGRVIIFNKPEKQDTFSPSVLASIKARDFAGNEAFADIEWDKIVPKKTSSANQYFYLKNHLSAKSLYFFGISSVFYKALLLFFFVSLVFYVLANTGKLRIKTVLSTIGLISFLLLLLII